MPDLGRLEKVDLRDIWKTEAGDFTPWLAKSHNMAILGEVIGLDLEVQAREEEVGPFRADILCQETASDHVVLIENQLEKTDHTHLGQLMTYASGLNAVSIVWIAERFTDEHRAALDWLNEITDEDINFFGLEVELWRIGDSPVAPKFNVVSKPNDWVKTIKGSAKTNTRSVLKQTQFEFWTAFKELMDPNSFLRCPNPQPKNWLFISIGRTGFKLAPVASTWNSETEKSTGEIRAELYIDVREHAKVYFELFLADKDSIEAELGESPIWYNPPNKKACKIYFRKPVDILNREDWPSQHAWLKEKLELLHTVFADRVKTIDLP